MADIDGKKRTLDRLTGDTSIDQYGKLSPAELDLLNRANGLAASVPDHVDQTAINGGISNLLNLHGMYIANLTGGPGQQAQAALAAAQRQSSAVGGLGQTLAAGAQGEQAAGQVASQETQQNTQGAMSAGNNAALAKIQGLEMDLRARAMHLDAANKARQFGQQQNIAAGQRQLDIQGIKSGASAQGTALQHAGDVENQQFWGQIAGAGINAAGMGLATAGQMGAFAPAGTFQTPGGNATGAQINQANGYGQFQEPGYAGVGSVYDNGAFNGATPVVSQQTNPFSGGPMNTSPSASSWGGGGMGNLQMPTSWEVA